MGAVTTLCCGENNQHQPSRKATIQKTKQELAILKDRTHFTTPKKASEQTISGDSPPPSEEPKNSEECLAQGCLKDITNGLTRSESNKMCWSDFKIEYLIGTGGFGQVFLGQLRKDLEKENRQRFAIKRMRKEEVVKKSLAESILLEKKILSQSASPFLTRMHYAFRDRHYLYIVMEWAEGSDTFTLLKKTSPRHAPFKAMGEPALRFILGCAIMGLEYLHSKKIIYRDLKPQNLLIFGNGYVKLTDFGLARQLKEEEGAKTMVGTTIYYAPEMVMGQQYGYGVDLWTLGVYAYEMSNFAAPFAPIQIVNKAKCKRIVINKEKNRRWHNEGLSDELKDLINSFLRFEPKARLGMGGWAEVKSHPFFAGFSWQDLQAGRMQSPLMPLIENYKSDYKPYNAIRMNPKIKDSSESCGQQVFQCWSVHSAPIKPQ